MGEYSGGEDGLDDGIVCNDSAWVVRDNNKQNRVEIAENNDTEDSAVDVMLVKPDTGMNNNQLRARKFRGSLGGPEPRGKPRAKGRIGTLESGNRRDGIMS